MTRPALTTKDWQALSRAMFAWAEDASGADLRAALEPIIQERVATAWDQGHRRGWGDGVSDAMDDGPHPVGRNPYREVTR